MKRIMVFSDSHGNSALLKTLIDKNEKPDMIFHLGDYYIDMSRIRDLPKDIKVYTVPGIAYPGYDTDEMQLIKSIEIDGVKFSLVHRLQDIFSFGKYGKINLFGHTHKPEIFVQDDMIFVNPGHTKSETDRGYKASYALIELHKNKIEIKIIDYQDEIIKEYTEDLNVNWRY